MNKLQYMLSSSSLTAPLMRYLAHVKNDVLKDNFMDILIKEKMVKGWKEMEILDLGSGPCNRQKDRRFKGVNFTCVDIFKPYLRECEKLNCKTINADIKEAVESFPDNSFDIIWALDVLEHLKKHHALSVIKRLDKIARKQVIVWIPHGYCPQDADAYEDGNVHQEHLSTWSERDFEKLGYKVEVMKDYYKDIRSFSKSIPQEKGPVPGSQMWAIKNMV